jgi:hypothetical protein
MSRPELARRMAATPYALFLEGVRMARQGYSAHAIARESALTLKQANAAYEWASRYGSINPFTSECAA